MAKKKRTSTPKRNAKVSVIRQDKHVTPTPERMAHGDVVQYGNRYISKVNSLELMMRRNTITEEQYEKCCQFFEWKAFFDVPLSTRTARYEREIYYRNDVEDLALGWADKANKYFYISSRIGEKASDLLIQVMECGFTLENIQSFYHVGRPSAVAMLRQALDSVIFHMHEIERLAQDGKKSYGDYNSYNCVKSHHVVQECHA